ncbi:MAG: DUF1934 domain-containing protein [Lachnospiraceae bacterium]
MKKDVVIKVRGLQPDVDAAEAIEVISTGTYQRKGDTHYLSYEEADEDGKLTKNRIKITKDSLEMVKQGNVTTQMFFATGQKQYTCYSTPFGDMTLGTTTNHLFTTEEDGTLAVRLVYELEINEAYVSECELDIEVKEFSI